MIEDPPKSHAEDTERQSRHGTLHLSFRHGRTLGADLALVPALSLKGLLEGGLVEGNPVVMWVGLCSITVVTLFYVIFRIRSRQRR